MKPLALALVFSLGLTTAARPDDVPAPIKLDLWPGQAPGEQGKVDEEKLTKEKGTEKVTSITNVTVPTLTVHRPDPSRDAHVAVVVCPGGGYNNLAWDHEGEQVARWLNDLGVTAALLKYRVPRRPGSPRNEPPPQALMDAQRALGMVRSRADEWKLDPKRIGILGFSAGGHLAAWASTNFDRRTYEPVDAADKAECRPDFAVLIYPGGVVKGKANEFAPEIKVSSQTPPMFLAHAGNDRVPAENSIMLYLALKQAGIPAELHIYASGGHGFGMRPSKDPSSTWSKRCEDWLKNQGILKPAEGRDR